MNRRSAGFWFWPVGAALGVAGAIGLDITLVAFGDLPAVPALLFTFALPGVGGLVLGAGNGRARMSDLLLMAAITAGALYAVMIVIAVVGVATSSSVSCAEPNAPWNCDNDIGAGVGLFLGMLLVAPYGVASWLGSQIGAAFGRRWSSIVHGSI